MFQEYPKALYLNGELEGDHVVVNNAEEEAEKRPDGYRMLAEFEKEDEAPKRTRKAKQ